MSADIEYARLLEAATRPVTVRGYKCRRGPPVALEFRSTPLVSLRRTAWRSALKEFEWFMSGSTRVDDLPPEVRPWWAPWSDGAGYGRFAEQLKAGDLCSFLPEDGFPACCFTGLTLRVYDDGLRLTTLQRSCDLICGAPHDWVHLWALGLWQAKRHGVPLRSVLWCCADPHVYEAHDDVVLATLNQRPQVGPELRYSGDGETFRHQDFHLDGPYTPALTMKAEMQV